LGPHLVKTELPHLHGFRASLPIRVGNAALEQLQLDIYGELMDANYLSDKYGDRYLGGLGKESSARPIG